MNPTPFAVRGEVVPDRLRESILVRQDRQVLQRVLIGDAEEPRDQRCQRSAETRGEHLQRLVVAGDSHTPVFDDVVAIRTGDQRHTALAVRHPRRPSRADLQTLAGARAKLLPNPAREARMGWHATARATSRPADLNDRHHLWDSSFPHLERGNVWLTISEVDDRCIGPHSDDAKLTVPYYGARSPRRSVGQLNPHGLNRICRDRDLRVAVCDLQLEGDRFLRRIQ